MSAPLQPVRWPAEAIWEAVYPHLPGFSVEVVPEIDSTNTELMRRARAGQADPVLLVAERQTAGRGRMGKAWHSGVGDTLMFSLGLPLAPLDWSGLSLAVGLSVAESLQPVLPVPGQAEPAIGIKWPNDLWMDGARKLCGILIETGSLAGAEPGTRYVVVGVGVNIRPRPGEGLSTVPACLQELHPGIEAHEALARIAVPLVHTVRAFASAGFAALQPRYAQRDVLRGRVVTLSDGREGLCQGVGPDGALLVQTAQGLESITSAEVSVRPVPNKD
jgi:BirA family biotin operon repressor/biotin-[acetyl-CoA-carboxylase] ligase